MQSESTNAVEREKRKPVAVSVVGTPLTVQGGVPHGQAA